MDRGLLQDFFFTGLFPVSRIDDIPKQRKAGVNQFRIFGYAQDLTGFYLVNDATRLHLQGAVDGEDDLFV
ncbi:hypothetical protein D3C72_2409320 [compost metagenome]